MCADWVVIQGFFTHESKEHSHIDEFRQHWATLTDLTMRRRLQNELRKKLNTPKSFCLSKSTIDEQGKQKSKVSEWAVGGADVCSYSSVSLPQGQLWLHTSHLKSSIWIKFKFADKVKDMLHCKMFSENVSFLLQKNLEPWLKECHSSEAVSGMVPSVSDTPISPLFSCLSGC